MGYSIALIEKPVDDGLSKGEIVNLAFIIDGDEFIPIQFEALKHESVAMGFIAKETADKFEYEYEESGLHGFIANILDDMENEHPDHTYEYNGVGIWLSR